MSAKVKIATLLRKQLGKEVADAMSAKVDKMISQKKSAADIETVLQADLSALNKKVLAAVGPSIRAKAGPSIQVTPQPKMKVSVGQPIEGTYQDSLKVRTPPTGAVPGLLRKGPK